MDQVARDLIIHQILIPAEDITNAFRLFLVSKQDSSARPVLDLSPWIPYYETPPLRLYTAAEILQTIPEKAQIIKLDLKAGFFQTRIHPQCRRYYGIYYRGQKFHWTSLPMGHPLAPGIMQRFSMAISRTLHQRFDTVIVAYLDDWLFFSEVPDPSGTDFTTPYKHGCYN
jgi:hypothetical protein